MLEDALKETSKTSTAGIKIEEGRKRVSFISLFDL
jgi:hypothetical protein